MPPPERLFRGIGPVRRALRKHDGDIDLAAHDLDLSPHTLRKHLKKHQLWEFGVQLRAEADERRTSVESQEILRLLVEHRGNVSAVAAALELPLSSLESRIDRRGLRKLVGTIRPQKPPAKQERAALLDAIRRTHGHLGRAAEQLGISRRTLTARVLKHGLVEEAHALRAKANISGPRSRVPAAAAKEQRAKLLAVFESCGWNLSRAGKELGVWPSTLYKMMRDLQLKRPKQSKPTRRLQQLVDALRLSRGVVAKAAAWLHVPTSVVVEWCREFEIDPRQYRAG